jgi:hypothetical protein
VDYLAKKVFSDNYLKFLKRLTILGKSAKKTLDLKAKELGKDLDLKNAGIPFYNIRKFFLIAIRMH